MMDEAMAESLDGGLRFERRLAHPPQRVWRAITDSADLAAWLIADGSVDAREGGAVLLRWSDTEVARGVVTRCEPPHLLEYTWQEGEQPESVVRFELTPVTDGTLLVLTHMRIESRAGFGAGWHAHLDLLAGLLDGRDVEWQERWDALLPSYREAY
jgi:uncharacterized protein YndB with AHSA1/START domain